MGRRAPGRPPPGRGRHCRGGRHVAGRGRRPTGLGRGDLSLHAGRGLDGAGAARARGGRARGRRLGRVSPTRGGYPRWYGFTHACPELLEQAVYSMPEATGDVERLRGARLVSNPGCYATASTLAVLPLISAGVIERDGVIIDRAEWHDRRRQEGQRGLLVLRGRRRLPRLSRAAPPAHAGDRAGAVTLGRGLGPHHLDVAPAADAAGDPGDGVRAPAGRQDRSRRGGGHQVVRRGPGRSCAPPGRMRCACRRWSAPTARCWVPTPIPSATS